MLEPCPTCPVLCPYCPRLAPPEGWPAWIKANRPEHDFTVPPPPGPPPVRESVARYRRLQRLAAACLYRERTCGCNPGKCWAGYGTNLLDPTRLYAGDCAACLSNLPGLSA